MFPKNNEELSKILKICNEFKVPVTAYGTGTSLEGHVVGNDEGFTISMENFNKIISINEADFDCRVQANVSREELNETLKDKGVFFPIDPGANASLGGMAACSASGTMAVRYGTMKTTVLGLTVVMANGEIINTGTRSKKTSAGYNLTNLFVGSEGTLGIITEVHLRLSPIPESIMSAVCQFPDLDSAVLTAQEIIQYGVPIARVELLNKDQMDISIKYSKLENLESLPTLFYEFHGSEISNKESIDVVEEISKNNNGSEFKWAANTEERNKIWKARHNVYYSVKAQGDDVRVFKHPIHPLTKDQLRSRVILDIAGSDILETDTYVGQGITETTYKPIEWNKQKADLIIKGDVVSKGRENIKASVYPTAHIIQDVSPT